MGPTGGSGGRPIGGLRRPIGRLWRSMAGFPKKAIKMDPKKGKKGKIKAKKGKKRQKKAKKGKKRQKKAKKRQLPGLLKKAFQKSKKKQKKQPNFFETKNWVAKNQTTTKKVRETLSKTPFEARNNRLRAPKGVFLSKLRLGLRPQRQFS